MRLGKITAIGPSGAQVEVVAIGEEGLTLSIDREAHKMVIGDPGLPPMVQAGMTSQRYVAIIPVDWALVYDWEHTTPVQS